MVGEWGRLYLMDLTAPVRRQSWRIAIIPTSNSTTVTTLKMQLLSVVTVCDESSVSYYVNNTDPLVFSEDRKLRVL